MPFQGYPHQNPYDYGQDIVTDTASGRQYGSQQEMQRQQQREAANAAYMRMIMSAGGQGGGGGGGGGMSPGGGGMGGLAQSYADAYSGARGANESRYNDIMGGFDQLMGGGQKPAPKKTGHTIASRPVAGGKYGAYKGSGSPLGYFEWLRLNQQGERQALQNGGQFGSMDASRLYPREWGDSGQFLGSPSQAGGQSSKPQRPTVAPPQYPTYTPPTRGNQNY